MTMTAAPTGEEAPPAAVAVSTGKAPPPPAGWCWFKQKECVIMKLSPLVGVGESLTSGRTANQNMT